MNNLPIVSQNNNKLQLVQSIEKEQDTLILRKKLAKEHGLTSIGEFIEGRAIVHKDDRRRIMNEQGEYMRDPSIKNLQYKKIDTSGPGCIGFSYEEGNMNGNGDFVRTEEDNTDIVQSKHWIFSAKDGIIIVVDDRSYSPGSRLYTTTGNRIPISEGREFERFAVTDIDYHDNFSLLGHFMYCNHGSNIHCYDRRKNIIQGMVPVEISHKFKMDNREYKWREIAKIHNLGYDHYGYNVIDKNGQFLKTELGQYYSYPSRVKSEKNTTTGLLACIHSELSHIISQQDKKNNDENQNREQYVLYAIDKSGKVLIDEFANTLFFRDPNWISEYNSQGYMRLSPNNLVLDLPFIQDIEDDGRIKVQMLWINESGKYLRDKNNCIITNQESYMRKFGSQDIIKTHDDTYGPSERENNINRGDTKERIYKVLSEDLIIYGHGTKIDHESPRGGLNSYGGDAKIVNKKMNFKNVQFPDGKDIFNYDFDHDFKQFGKSFIFHGNHVDPRGGSTYECLKINGIIARYNKDEEGKELENISTLIKSVDDKYLFIQRKKGESYYILNKHFQYIKDKNGEKLSFTNRPPFYVDGIFLYYDTIDGEPQTRSKKEMYLRDAYFEDGSKIGEEYISLDNSIENITNITNKRITKLL